MLRLALRVARRLKIQGRVSSEIQKMLQYTQAEQLSRAEGESSVSKVCFSLLRVITSLLGQLPGLVCQDPSSVQPEWQMLDGVTDKLNTEIRAER